MPQRTLAGPVPLPSQKVEAEGSFAVSAEPPLGREASRPGRSPVAAAGRPEISLNSLRVPVFSPEQQVARMGLRGPARPLPFLQQIQRSFGPYDVRRVETFAGAEARRAAAGLDAGAYATEGSVVFGKRPDLFMAAHEAAHVVQQRGAVRLAGGLGQAGDRYERHADQVASRVVRGESAVPLLAGFPAAGGSAAQPGLIQRIGPSYIPKQDGPNVDLAADQPPGQVGNVSFDHVADSFYEGHDFEDSDKVYLEENIPLYTNDDQNDDKQLARYKDISPYLGQIDHIVPEAKGGGTSFINAQLVSAQANQQKGDTYPDPISGYSGSRIFLGTRIWDMPAGTILEVSTEHDAVRLDDEAKIPTANSWNGTLTTIDPAGDDDQFKNNTNHKVAINAGNLADKQVWIDHGDAQAVNMAPPFDLPED